MSIKLLNGVIDIFQMAGGKETVIIRGVVNPECLRDIKVAPYQREVIPGARVKDLKNALKTSTVPDIELGMRGGKYRVNTSAQGDTFFLQDDVFVIDGLQRKSAGEKLVEEDPSATPRIGAVVHLDTTEEWEAERFRILNQDRLKLNSNVLLRNARVKSPAIEMIYNLTQDESFVLCERVQWSQRKSRTEFLTALGLCSSISYLHSRFSPGKCYDLAVIKQLDRMMDVVGRNTMRDNIKTFFDLIDECYGLRRIVYSHSATALRVSFLVTVATLFANYSNFWRGHRLFVEKDLRSKIAKFPINDPGIVNLASSGGKARDILYQTFLGHINSGKRTKRLVPADGVVETELVTIDEPSELVEAVG